MNTITTEITTETGKVPAKARKANSSKRRMARERGNLATMGTAGESESPQAAVIPAPTSKIASVIVLLEREQGATLAEMVEATGWLPHTTRAALTGLKKKGHVIAKEKREGATCYRIAKAN